MRQQIKAGILTILVVTVTFFLAGCGKFKTTEAAKRRFATSTAIDALEAELQNPQFAADLDNLDSVLSDSSTRAAVSRGPKTRRLVIVCRRAQRHPEDTAAVDKCQKGADVYCNTINPGSAVCNAGGY